LRQASDEIEIEGIRRSRGALADAELILHVLDAAEPLSAADQTLLSDFAQKKRLLIRNKTDLPIRLELPPGLSAVDVCCLTGKGIEELKNAIKEKVWAGEIQAGMWQVMINARHQDALQRARVAIERTVAALQGGLGLELAALDLRIGANAVWRNCGQNDHRRSTRRHLQPILHRQIMANSPSLPDNKPC